MKKNYLFGMVAMAALTMMSCSQDVAVNDYSPENAIEFGTYVGRDAQGRGSIYVDDNLKVDGFGVFAYYTGQTAWDEYTVSTKPNFMNNTHVTYSANSTDIRGNWTYSPVKYWPNNTNDKVSFFAYAPYEQVRVLNNGKLINITVDPDVTNHIDYVVAEAKTDVTKPTAIGGNVDFNFKHVLSRVGFKVEAMIDEKNEQSNAATDTDNQDKTFYDNNTTITIQEVELIGNFTKSQSIDFTTSTWFDDADTYTQNDNFSGYLLKYDEDEDNNDFTEVASNCSISNVKSDLLNKDSEYMMIIPKKFNNNNTNPGQVQIRVKYTVTTVDANLVGGSSIIVNNITSEPFNFDFQKGQAYNFVLHLGLTSVKLSAQVSNWDGETDVVVNVPIN